MTYFITSELPAGQITEFLVGFTNKGESEMTVESLEASLRYPMDFTFHIQNFSAIPYMKQVKKEFIFKNLVFVSVLFSYSSLKKVNI